MSSRASSQERSATSTVQFSMRDAGRTAAPAAADDWHHDPGGTLLRQARWPRWCRVGELLGAREAPIEESPDTAEQGAG